MRLTGSRVGVLMLGMLWAQDAAAVDGVIEINQACALVGCLPGDDPGFPVVAFSGGSFRLTSDLVIPDPGVEGVFLGDDQTLDLNGFTIRGPRVCTGTPVTSCTPPGQGGLLSQGLYLGDRAFAHGGHIRGFDVGVSTGRGARAVDLTVSDNSAYGVVLASGSSLRDSVVVSNAGRGIQGVNKGIGDVQGVAATVSGCDVRFNGEHGVVLEAGAVQDSQIHDNGGIGLFAQGDVGYSGNVVSGNGTANTLGGLALGCNLIGSTRVCPP